ncbi:hypothetical protein GQ607_003404 [Colletotrichum asianum]|uniref:Uncharacterized protein n=1 Tax=Colletotrichum asianum TaxID=702518 RepID=A0A8H3ZY61_9PEZI|nr:hypothetical protein GQ607_003404 [Colletotrichum asianum]
MSSWAPRWFGKQWITVDDLYRHDDLSGNETPEPKLGDKRWKRDTIIARGNELCSLDISTFDNADLATLYEHLVDVDETMLHIKDDWPLYHMSKEQIASDETQALVAKRLTERHDHIRAIINKRRLGWKLSLNDFPTEIINRIIDHCEDYSNLADSPEYVDAEYEVDQQELNTIKSLRLTCHRLNELASLRLIPSITISPTEESLSRLENVSKHGVFGKAIKRVRLVMGYYSRMATTTAATFSYYASETMNRAFLSRELDWGVGVSRNPHESNFIPFFGNLSKADKEKLFRLRGRLSELSEDSDSLAEEELAWKAYNRYIQRHQEYQGLMGGDHFVRRVTEAIALLPRAHRLDVYDYTHEPNDWRHKYVSTGRVTSDESLIELLAAPMEWNRLAADFNPGQNPSVDALGKLLPALGKAGVRLKAFEMNVTPPIDFKPLFSQTEEARLHTNELLRDVWFLRLCIKARPMFAVTDGDGISNFWPCRSADEDKALDGFIDTLLSSESLGWLQLNFEDLILEKGAGGWFLPAVMKPRRTSHPCRMDLLHVWLDSGMMDAFLGDGPLFLTLGAPIMKHGTWMEALTIMRQKFKHDDLNLVIRRQSSLSSCMRGMHGLVVGDIQFVNGGECDGMNVFDYDDTFGDPKGSGKDRGMDQDDYVETFDEVERSRDDGGMDGNDNVETFSEAEGSGDDGGMDEDDSIETISESEGTGFVSPAMDYIHHERDDNPLSRFNSE